jgi:hypothetical protein
VGLPSISIVNIESESPPFISLRLQPEFDKSPTQVRWSASYCLIGRR